MDGVNNIAVDWQHIGPRSAAFLCARHVTCFGGASPLRTEVIGTARLGKGVHREMESEGSRRRQLEGRLKGFAIARDNRKFVWADARIDGITVVVSSSEVAKPVAVRYGWDVNPVCNLYNEEALPAIPFRSDDWPGLTGGNR